MTHALYFLPLSLAEALVSFFVGDWFFESDEIPRPLRELIVDLL